MSCQIRLTAQIQDVANIRTSLFSSDDTRGAQEWLQSCLISPSPTSDYIILARKRRLVVLSSVWDKNTEINQFQITFEGAVHEYDTITAVVCLPVTRQHSSVELDWTCIVVGYDSGFVRFYTESCELLLEEQFHCENITSIKCQSQHNPRPDICSDLHQEEIYVQYQSNVAVLNGRLLFNTLRLQRNQLGKAPRRLVNPDPASGIIPRKWGFHDQSVINDTAVVGLSSCSSFDHLLTASVCGGFDTVYRAMPPNNTLVLGAGSKPFLAYHYALEGGNMPILSDVAKAVANKISSVLPDWLSGSSKPPPEKPISQQSIDMMGCRFGLYDLQRTSCSVILSPNKKLAAVCDNLGRVLLVDAYKGIFLRILKGYRDAQCSFIQVLDEKKAKHRAPTRAALFLVIYSSKKGTIEIFTAQQATKIATFKASKYSRLLYVNYGLMGFTKTQKSRYVCQFTTVFIDNDGSVKEILIPFHFALEENNSKRSRDIHLYKKLRHLVKSDDFELEFLEQFACSTCAELNTLEIRKQTIELLLTSKNVTADVMLKCLDVLEEKLLNESQHEELLKLVQINKTLLNFYLYITLLESDHNGNTELKDEEWLDLDSKDLTNLQKLLDLNTLTDNTSVKVKFSDEQKFTASCFLTLFDSKDDSITLKTSLQEDFLYLASENLFANLFKISYDKGEFQKQIFKSKIVPKDLFSLLIIFWVNRPLNSRLNIETEMKSLHKIVQVLVEASVDEDLTVSYNETSQFWSEIRNVLAESPRPFPALTAAILCKNIASNLEAASNEDEDCNMEVLSQEKCLWTLLIGKLEDVSLLNIILATKPKVLQNTLPKLNFDSMDISLKYVLEKGSGSVSELVAKWLTQNCVDPNMILTGESAETVMDHLTLLRTQFPYSLEVSNLLANMSWEYSLAWQKSFEDMQMLEAALKCLKLIPDAHIKTGLYNLTWNVHLKVVFESVCKLINKVGKLPKERLCKQDTWLTDYQITIFVTTCTTFFEEFMECLQESSGSTPIAPQFEPIWEKPSQALVHWAISQRDLNYDLIQLHQQLSLVLQMICTLNIKQSKSIHSLFELATINQFFIDFKSKVDVKYNETSAKTNSVRLQFLTKVIGASLETIVVNSETSYYSEHVTWMAKCVNLARCWNLDVDLLRRFQIVELYSKGFDSLAEELLPAVNNTYELGKELIIIAGNRLSLFMCKSPNLSENISALSPSLTIYLHDLEKNNINWVSPSSLDNTVNLTTHVIQCLQDQRELNIANLLLEACLTLRQNQNVT